MTAGEKEKLHLETNDHFETNPASLNVCHRSVLNIIAERSPCPEPKLFITAINSGLECFGGRPLADLRQLLGECIEDLKAAGLVDVVENAFVVADIDQPSAEEEDTAEDTTEPERHDHAGESADQDPAKARGSETQKEHEAATDEPGEMDEPPAEESIAVSSEAVEDADVFDLTDELELIVEELSEGAIDQKHPPSDMPQAGADATDDARHGQEPPREDLEISSPDNADDADVFDLTDEIELVSEEQDETATNLDRTDEDSKTDSAAEGSEEIAGPSREEIIAALRQFASGEETHNK